ncbi:MAG: GNAT family acetyltransferase [Oceanococcus sp.]
MLIRPYRNTDEHAVVALWQRCNLTKPWNDPHRDIQRKLTLQADLFLVGEVAGVAVATVMIGFDGHRGWVNYLAVAPECRKQGLGRQLMHCAEEKLQALGCPKLNLQVRESNEAVLAFYEALGYAVDPVVSFGKRLIPDEPQ